MAFQWPAGFPRIPSDDWTQLPLEDLALKYDTVEHHGWYANLDPTVDDLAALLDDGDIVMDYSGGTGILIDRLLQRLPHAPFGVLNVDSSPKFLRLALEKFRHEERVAFRLIRYLKAERRLQLVTEVLEPALSERGFDAIASTNAIHLYHELEDTLRSWHQMLRAGGRVLAQSGNIRLEDADQGWIIDDTVEAVEREARAIVCAQAEWAPYAAALEDQRRMDAYAAHRQKVFLPARPLAYYLEAFAAAGFDVLDVRTRPIPVRTADWYEFLSVYHDGILPWVGGSEKVDGHPPRDVAVHARLALLRAALDRVFHGRDRFEATWTYITCGKAG